MFLVKGILLIERIAQKKEKQLTLCELLSFATKTVSPAVGGRDVNVDKLWEVEEGDKTSPSIVFSWSLVSNALLCLSVKLCTITILSG